MPAGAEYAGGLWPLTEALLRPQKGMATLYAERLYDDEWYAVLTAQDQAAKIEADTKPWYACGGSIPATGQAALTEANVRCVNVLILSHIGGRTDAPPVTPTAAIADQGSYQYIYRLKKPYPLDTDGKRKHLQKIMAARIPHGWATADECTATQCFRLPNAGASLQYWNVQAAYDFEELADKLGLKRGVEPSIEESQAPRVEVAGIEDPVLKWLKDNNRIVREGTDGWYAFQCPWAHQHTEAREEAHYSPLGQGEVSDMRSFSCFDPACKEANRDVHGMLGWVAAEGGPKLRASELSIDAVANITDADMLKRNRNALIRRLLPAIRIADLPDVDLGVGRKPERRQLFTRANLEYVVGRLGMELRYNMAERQSEVLFRDERVQDLLLDTDHGKDILYDVCLRLGMQPPMRRFQDLLRREAQRDSVHPMEAWILSKPWDGKSRVDALIRTVLIGEEQFDAIWPIYCRRWLIQAVQAVCGWRDPQQIGQVLVLQGGQGIGKTRWFLALAPSEFTAESISLHMSGYSVARDSTTRATRRPLVELGELDSTFKRSMTSSLNGFLTATRDIFRPVYAETEVEHVRATVFFGTVNPRSFLVDNTGSRRYWVVPVRWCIADHGLDMQQVWAEVKERWDAGEKWWLTPEEDKLRVQLNEAFQWRDPVNEAVTTWFETHTKDEVQIMNVTEFAARMKLPIKREHYAPMREAIEGYLGPARKLRGRKRVWAIPVAKVRHLTPVEGTNGRQPIPEAPNSAVPAKPV